MSDAKRRLLAARLQGTSPRAAEHEIPPRTIAGPVPATRLQEAMWVLNELTGDHAAYNIHFGLECVGSLDAEKLNESIAAVGQRHESLRCAFENREGRLFISDRGRIEHDHVVLDLRDAADAQAAAEDHAIELARRPFDLHEAPLWRSALIRFADDAWLLVFVVHHIVCDERSLELLIEDLLEHYRRRLRGAADPPPRERDYSDYACWLSDRLEKHRQRHLEYWRAHLDDADGRIELPTDFPRGPRQEFAGALAEHETGASLAGAVTALARASDASPFVVLLAAFNFLMDRYTGESAVTVGTPVSLRGPSPTTEMIGLFINALPLRRDIDHATGFDRLLASTRDGFIAALEHKDLPFDDLVAALAPRRDASHNPFFQVMFVMETELAPSPVPDLDVRFRMFDTGSAKFDLTVFARLSGNGLRLSAEYNTELFEAETVETLLKAYGAVLAEVTASPQQPLAKIGLVPPASREAIVDGAWGPSVDLSGVAPLSDQILEQAAHTPADQALIQGDRRVDYADLERASADLGAALSEAGHEGNDPVAIVLERSPDYPIALLAVMRAGGAYVPIDAAAPPARMAQVIQELTAGCQGRRPLAICAAHHRARVTAAGAQAVTPGAAVSADASARGPTPPDLAYIIYTSGSTGRPKGVAITHANLAASTEARNAFYGGAPARFLLVSPFHFDSSVAGIYWTLAAGGTLILPAADNAADPRHLAATIAKEDVTHVLLLPGLYSLLLDAAEPGQLDSLKTVIVAGEALSRELVESHCARLPATELVNEYGPTEGTVWTTATRCTPDRRTPSIGRPIANAGAYVVDSDLNPLVAGAAGELCIAGAGVADGYYLQPKQTTERFLADPFRRSGRIYRSGDRVRRRADGSLEFLGRLDAQLKISGYRIEPAEIETALIGLDGIDEAAVVARNTPGNRATTLVAWCTPNQDDQAGAEVAEALAGSLPDYMIPRSIRFCESLPRTATGKIDRHVLRARDIDLPAAVDRPHRKLTPTERSLAGLWRTLLGVEKLSAESHFFDLGGHSLLGVTLMLEVDRAFDCALPLSVLFESPTLGGLAQRIDGVEGISAPFEFLNPYQIGGSQLPLFIVQGDVRETARQLGPDQPIYLAYRGLDGVSTDELSVERYARLTLEEVRRVQPEGPYQIFGYSFGGQVALEMAKVLARDGERMAVLGLIDPPSTEEASYARLEAKRLRARLQSVGGPLAQFGHLLRMAPKMTVKLLRRGWQRLRAVQLSRRGQPLPKELVMARDRAYYIRTSAGYRYERYEGDLLLIVPEGHAGSGEKTITAWQSLVQGRLTSHIIAGALDHEDLLLPPWQGKVAAVIGESLATAASGADDAGDMPGDRSGEAARDEAQEVPG